MDNKVGDDVPSAKELAKLHSQLRDVVDALREFGITLDEYQRRRLVRPRRGADAQIARVHELAVKYEVKLPNIPLEGMANDLALSKAIQPFEDTLRAALQLAEDTGAQADSEAWEAFLAYYGTLSGMAARIPELAEELAPVVDFMRPVRRKKGPPAGGSSGAPG